jgi:hypothetical protein
VLLLGETFCIIQFTIIQIPFAIVLIYSATNDGTGGTFHRSLKWWSWCTLRRWPLGNSSPNSGDIQLCAHIITNWDWSHFAKFRAILVLCRWTDSLRFEISWILCICSGEMHLRDRRSLSRVLDNDAIVFGSRASPVGVLSGPTGRGVFQVLECIPEIHNIERIIQLFWKYIELLW